MGKCIHDTHTHAHTHIHYYTLYTHTHSHSYSWRLYPLWLSNCSKAALSHQIPPVSDQSHVHMPPHSLLTHSPTHPRSQWIAESTGRTRAAPHIKSYCRVSKDGNRAAWFLLTRYELDVNTPTYTHTFCCRPVLICPRLLGVEQRRREHSFASGLTKSECFFYLLNRFVLLLLKMV